MLILPDQTHVLQILPADGWRFVLADPNGREVWSGPLFAWALVQCGAEQDIIGLLRTTGDNGQLDFDTISDRDDFLAYVAPGDTLSDEAVQQLLARHQQTAATDLESEASDGPVDSTPQPRRRRKTHTHDHDHDHGPGADQ